MLSAPRTPRNVHWIQPAIRPHKRLFTSLQGTRTQPEPPLPPPRIPSFYHFVNNVAPRPINPTTNKAEPVLNHDQNNRQGSAAATRGTLVGTLKAHASSGKHPVLAKGQFDDATLAEIAMAELGHCGESPLPPEVLDPLLALLVKRSDAPAVQHALCSLYPSVLHRLQSLSPLRIAEQPPAIISHAFVLVRCLMKTDLERTVSLFETLVERQHIPTFVFLDERVGSLSAHNMIYSACIRAAVHWRWTATANRFLEESLATNTYSPELIGDLIRDVIEVLIDDGTNVSLASVHHLLRITHSTHSFNDLIVKAYEKAATINASKEAWSLYECTKDIEATQSAVPLPPNSVIRWLAESATEDGSRENLNDLLDDVIRQNPRVPPLDRRPLIHCALRRGLLPQAKLLWEMYAPGPSGETVRGNAALMLDIVSQFAPLGRQANVRAREDASTSSDAPPSQHGPAADGFLEFARAVYEAYSVEHRPLRWASSAALLAMAKAQFLLRSPAMGYYLHAKAVKKLERKLCLEDIKFVRSASFISTPGAEAAWVQQYLNAQGRISTEEWADLFYQAMIKGDLRSVKYFATMYNQDKGEHRRFSPVQQLILAAVSERPDDSPTKLEKRLVSVGNAIQTLQYPSSVLARQHGILASLVKSSLSIQRPDLAFWFWHNVWHLAAPSDQQDHASLRKSIVAQLEASGFHDRVEKLNRLERKRRR